MNLTKVNLVETIAEAMQIEKKKCGELLEATIELIKKSLENGDDVLISGFGKFCVRSKKERIGRNPATSEPLLLKPRHVVTFKCSGTLRAKLNQPPAKKPLPSHKVNLSSARN